MSRQSTASLSVVPVQALTRIEPPADLTAEELALWTAVVESKPVEWFGEDSAPLLTEYVRAKVMCDLLDLKVKAAIAVAGDPESLGSVKAFLDMRDKESKRLLSIGTKLRLTQQSRYTPQAAATATKKAGGERPWARQG
jgi:hypothetical protein